MLGLDLDQVVDRLVLTPACGLAGASPAWTRTALELTRRAATQVDSDGQDGQDGQDGPVGPVPVERTSSLVTVQTTVSPSAICTACGPVIVPPLHCQPRLR